MQQLLERDHIVSKGGAPSATNGNTLFPVFLKLEELNVLLVGAGYVGCEKLNALLANSPNVQVKVVAIAVSNDFRDMASAFANITIVEKAFEAPDLQGAHIVIAATNDNALNQLIRQSAHASNLLVNVADKPELCDFYLSSIVKKGNLKIAISTNGKSPTMAKRLRELFQTYLPDEVDQSLEQLSKLREQLKGDFAYKVKRLNAATESLVSQEKESRKKVNYKWLFWALLVLYFMTIAFFLLPMF